MTGPVPEMPRAVSPGTGPGPAVLTGAARASAGCRQCGRGRRDRYWINNTKLPATEWIDRKRETKMEGVFMMVVLIVLISCSAGVATRYIRFRQKSARRAGRRRRARGTRGDEGNASKFWRRSSPTGNTAFPTRSTDLERELSVCEPRSRERLRGDRLGSFPGWGDSGRSCGRGSR